MVLPSSSLVGPTNLVMVRCPSCHGLEDKVVDSRTAEEGAAIRRRRECMACGRRFTTFERAEEPMVWVTKRSGRRELFDRSKIVSGIRAASKNRPVTREAIEHLTSEIEDAVRALGPEVSSQAVGREVLERLGRVDDVSYLRFASVYKGFEGVGDFQKELGLLTKSSPPKGAPGPGGAEPAGA